MNSAANDPTSGDTGAPRVRSTGPGPVGGTDAREACAVVVGECPELPFLPELADRGLGADLLGRTAAMLVDLPVDVSTRAWRLADAPGRAGRRAADLLDRDLDALEEAVERARPRGGVPGGDPLAGPGRAAREGVQVRVAGPWTLAARLELPHGRLVLADAGARRELAASLLEGVAATARRLSERVGAPARVVLDEPELWAVVAGAVPGPSEFDPVAAVAAERASTALSRFGAGLRERGVAEVLVRVPARPADGPPAAWGVLVDPVRGERALDGLVVDAGELVPRGDALSRRGDREQPRDERAVAALDAVSAALGDGFALQLEGAHRLAGLRAAPADPAAAERAAAGVLGLLDRLAAPRWTTLDRLVLSPTPAETRGAGVVAALAGAARTAEVLPRVAE